MIDAPFFLHRKYFLTGWLGGPWPATKREGGRERKEQKEMGGYYSVSTFIAAISKGERKRIERDLGRERETYVYPFTKEWTEDGGT